MKSLKFFFIFTIIFQFFLSELNSMSGITTLQYNDPSPFFSYNSKIKKNKQNKKRLTFNISPFSQKALMATDLTGFNFGEINSANLTAENYMGNFRGTPFIMGLFLGNDPSGNNIWSNGDVGSILNAIITPTNGTTITAPYVSGGNYNLSQASINNTLLPTNLKAVVQTLTGNTAPAINLSSGNFNQVPINQPTDILNNSVIFVANGITSLNTSGVYNLTVPTIFSTSVLSLDNVYFGAYSTPLIYQKLGLRFECNFSIFKNIILKLQGGFANIKQYYSPLSNENLKQSAGTVVDLNTLATNSTNTTAINIYNNLAYPSTSNSTTNANSTAQQTFLNYTFFNLASIFDATNGIGYDISNFDKTDVEDLRLTLLLNHSFKLKNSQNTTNPELELTPFAYFTFSPSCSKAQNYSKAYSLPIGNNGHNSLGGGIGCTFDFENNIDLSFELGGTYFCNTTHSNMPCPNSTLQRVLYPFKTNVIIKPGYNFHFATTFSAEQFIKNIDFLFSYKYMEHTQDKYSLETANSNFYPTVLENLSPFYVHLINSSFNFNIAENISFNFAWQTNIKQRNAYAASTLLGSLSFTF